MSTEQTKVYCGQCKWCGGEFSYVARQRSARKYHDKCRPIGNKHTHHERYVLKCRMASLMKTAVQEWTCQYCGAVFNGHKRGYCCYECRTWARRDKQRYKFTMGECCICSESFIALRPATLTCSAQCGRALYQRCRQKADIRRRMKRKDITAQIVHDDYTYKEIMDRDEWTCGLCGKLIEEQTGWPESLCGTIDHIVPVSKGGQDTRCNVQAAHLSCNSSKGNRVVVHGDIMDGGRPE